MLLPAATSASTGAPTLCLDTRTSAISAVHSLLILRNLKKNITSSSSPGDASAALDQTSSQEESALKPRDGSFGSSSMTKASTSSRIKTRPASGGANPMKREAVVVLKQKTGSSFGKSEEAHLFEKPSGNFNEAPE